MLDVSLDEQRKANPPLWSGNKGIFADLSDYPRSASYYVKCPDCGHVHGDFSTLRQAFDHRKCPACHFDQIEKIKKEAATAHLPEKPKKPRRHEAVTPSALVRRLLDESDDGMGDVLAGGAFDDLGSKEQMLSGTERGLNWVLDALDDLDEVITGGWELDDDNADAVEVPEEYDKIKLRNGSQEWVVYRQSETAEAEALEKVTEDLKESPELFTESWLSHYVDKEKLAREIGDPYADHEEETYGSMDYEEKLEALVEGDIIEDSDSRFFGEIVNEDDPEDVSFGPLEATPERESEVDELITELAEQTKPEFDPIEWLKDIYGSDEYMKEVLRMSAINIPEAAEAAIRDDGWAHFMGTYDGGHTDLGDDAVAIRLN